MRCVSSSAGIAVRPPCFDRPRSVLRSPARKQVTGTRRSRFSSIWWMRPSDLPQYASSCRRTDPCHGPAHRQWRALTMEAARSIVLLCLTSPVASGDARTDSSEGRAPTSHLSSQAPERAHPAPAPSTRTGQPGTGEQAHLQARRHRQADRCGGRPRALRLRNLSRVQARRAHGLGGLRSDLLAAHAAVRSDGNAATALLQTARHPYARRRGTHRRSRSDGDLRDRLHIALPGPPASAIST